MTTGKDLFAKYGADVLGPWEDQPYEVQRAWEHLAVGVTDTLEKQAEQFLLGSAGEQLRDDRP